MGGDDDQQLADPQQHQSAKRVINHRFVVNGQQLLDDGLDDWIQPRAAPAKQDDSPWFACATHP